MEPRQIVPARLHGYWQRRAFLICFGTLAGKLPAGIVVE